MLYDPKWEVEVKADPLSLESLISWLEKQPKRQAYCYLDHGQCLLGQYFAAAGYKNPHIYSNGLFLHGEDKQKIEYPHIFNSIALCLPRTFGGALKRARDAAHSRT